MSGEALEMIFCIAVIIEDLIMHLCMLDKQLCLLSSRLTVETACLYIETMHMYRGPTLIHTSFEIKAVVLKDEDLGRLTPSYFRINKAPLTASCINLAPACANFNRCTRFENL
jgi:hypothetical protein